MCWCLLLSGKKLELIRESRLRQGGMTFQRRDDRQWSSCVQGVARRVVFNCYQDKGQSLEDRPDVTTRVFIIKLTELLDDPKKKGFLGLQLG